MSQFIQTISRLNKSGTISELDDQLSKAVQAVRTTGKPAELTIKLKIRPNDPEGDRVLISDSISLKTATPPRKDALFFTTADGALSRNDPNQTELPLRSVAGGISDDIETQAAAQ